MKKILSLLIITVLTLMALVSCGHTHEFSADWSNDETHHWHACTVEGCTEVADKAEHSFGSLTSINETQHKKTCVCGKEITEDHSFGAWVDAGNGQHKKVCECGYEVTAAHAFGNWTSISDTQHKKTCECGASVTDGHTWGEGEVTTPATPTAPVLRPSPARAAVRPRPSLSSTVTYITTASGYLSQILSIRSPVPAVLWQI